MRKHHRLWVAAALVLVCLGAVISGAAAHRAAASKPVLRIGLATGPDNVNPGLASGDETAWDLIYAPLLHQRPDGKVVAGLATSWHYYGKAVHRNFELTLRHNARFSDGEQVNAKAVAGWLAFFERQKGQFAAYLGPRAKFQAAGKWTVRIHTTVPVPGIPAILCELYNWGWVAAPKVVAKPSLFSHGSWGAGPYMIDQARTVNGDHYTLVPNPYYYKKSAIRYSEVDVKIITDTSSMLQALKTGQLDIADGDPSTAAAAKAAGFKVLSTPYETIMMYISDWRGKLVKALGDVRVRQAINYAIDRKTITKGLFGQYATPTSILVTSDASPSRNFYPYNPAKAKALLKAAGYPNGFTMRAFDFAPGQFGDPLVQAAASDLAKVGIKVNIKPDSTGGVWEQDRNSKKFSMYYTGFPIVPTNVMTPTYLLPPDGNNFNEYDPVVEKLYYQGLKARNPIPYWKRMWQRVATQSYFMPLVMQNTVEYVSNRVGGVRTSQARVGMILPQEWYPTK